MPSQLLLHDVLPAFPPCFCHRLLSAIHLGYACSCSDGSLALTMIRTGRQVSKSRFPLAR